MLYSTVYNENENEIRERFPLNERLSERETINRLQNILDTGRDKARSFLTELIKDNKFKYEKRNRESYNEVKTTHELDNSFYKRVE